MKADENPLQHAPHTARAVTAAEWDRPYSREQARLPRAVGARRASSGRRSARIDNAYGDRNLFCTCPAVEDLAE